MNERKSNTSNQMIKQLILSLFFLSLMLSSLAQKGIPTIKIEGEMTFERGDYLNETTAIKLLKDGRVVDQIKEHNKFKFDLKVGHDYTVVFSQRGYVTKKVEILTYVPNKAPKSSYKSFSFDVELFKKVKGLDLLVFNQPIAVIDYNTKTKKLDYNYFYTKGVKMEIKNAKLMALKAMRENRVDSTMNKDLLSVEQEQELNDWRIRMVNEKIAEIERVNEKDIKEKTYNPKKR